jgi:hypothetical protein
MRGSIAAGTRAEDAIKFFLKVPFACNSRIAASLKFSLGRRRVATHKVFICGKPLALAGDD